MHAKRLLIIFLLAFPFIISACRFGKNVEPTKSVYATAFAILTQTAEKEASLPGRTPTPVLPGNSLLPASTAIPQANTPIPTDIDQTVNTPTSVSPVQDTRPSQPPGLQATTLPTRVDNQGFQPPTLTQPAAATTVVPTSTSAIPAPVQGLVGTWQLRLFGMILQYNQDGSYRLGESFSALASETIDEGQYTVQGDQVTMSGSSSSISCRNITGSYGFSAPTANERQFMLIQDACYDRQQILTEDAWYWLPVQPGATPSSPDAEEVPVQVIPLAGALSSPEARISGLDWYGEKLLLLPQNPRFSGNGTSNLYWITLETIIDFLNDIISGPLSVQTIALNDAALLAQINGFQGYQALAVNGNRIYLILHADSGAGLRSYLVTGTISQDANIINLDSTRLVEVPAQPESGLQTYRALIQANSEIILLPDLSGDSINNSPVALRYDANLNYLGTLSLSGIEYLITDATGLNSEGGFWVVNKYAPGDPGAIPGIDPLAQLYGTGVTHSALDYIERLVGYQYSASGITLSAAPPIQMELSAAGPRDWQGVVSLGNQGVLVITNQTPGTLLGYISYP